jgi:5-methylcytosine-specific restriction protein B
VTFHQSFSYEDFVEGLRAESGEDGQLRYEVVDGVFKNLCTTAMAKVTQQEVAPMDISNRRIWKMSLGNIHGSDSYVFDDCKAGNCALLGYGERIDFTGCTSKKDVAARFAEAGLVLPESSYPVAAVTSFVAKMKIGDLLIIPDGNSKFRAIGEVIGDYHCLNDEERESDYGQCRAVKWLRIYEPSLPYDQVMDGKFTQRTLYELSPSSLNLSKLSKLVGAESSMGSAPEGTSLPFKVDESFGTGYVVTHSSADIVELSKPKGNQLPIGMSILNTLADYVREGRLSIADIRNKLVFDKVPETKLDPFLVNGYNNILPALVERLVNVPSSTAQQPSRPPANNARVLIIDEINRGNISRIFGELITLIEPSKRAGAYEALQVKLPYSKKHFSVPGNVYLIGTMNTADRSLAALDIALRRRFSFVEMPPKPELLADVSVEGINISQLLSVMNERIAVLLDRDHCLGHAYFMPLESDPSLKRLELIFREQILPLLQEYFFEDWQRIQWVLNDQRKAAENRFLQQPSRDLARLFGDQVAISQQNQRWSLNLEAFTRVEAYLGVIDHAAELPVVNTIKALSSLAG